MKHSLALLAICALLLAACGTQPPPAPSPTAMVVMALAATPTAQPLATATSPATAVLPTATPVAPVTPTGTAIPLTATRVPPPPTAAATATPTAAPPTATRLPPTPTPHATATRVMPSATATAGARGSIVPPEIERGNTGRRQVTLTFDAGASAAPLPKILAALRQANIRSTFFLTGAWARENPDGVKAIAADGHEIFNHSDTHPNFTEISDQEIVRELAATEDIIQKLVGRTTRPYFRPPYGARDKRVLAAAWLAGYRCVYWTVDSGDWREDATVDGVVNKVLSNASDGAIFIEHVGSPQTAEGLPRIIAGLRARGYEIVPLSVLVQ